MKIAILTPTFSRFSGIDRVVELQAKALESKGNNVTIMTFKGGLRPKSIPVIELGLPKNPTLERVYRLFFKFHRSKIRHAAEMLKDQDLIISHFYPMNEIAQEAKRQFGIRWRYHNHGFAPPSLFPKFHEQVYLRLIEWLNNRSLKSADELVSISDYLRKVLKQKTGRDSRIEYDPIDTVRFNERVNKKKLRARLNLKTEPIVLYIGRLSPHKGIHLLIKAFGIVKKSFPKAHLLIVGKPTFPNYLKRLQHMAEAKEDVHFVGEVSDADQPLYYGAANIYATASLWEGFNMTIVEANACGVPVVAFNLGPHPEVLKKGTLVNPGNIQEFADAIVKILKKTRK